MVVYVAIVGGMGLLFVRLPTAFLPDEDQGVHLRAGAAAGRRHAASGPTSGPREGADYYLDEEKDAVELGLRPSPASASAAAARTPAWPSCSSRTGSEREPPAQNVEGAGGPRDGSVLRSSRTRMVFAFVPPAVLELGNATGFDVYLQDRGGLGHEALMRGAQPAPRAGRAEPGADEGAPQRPRRHAAVPASTSTRRRRAALGLSLADINTTLSSAWGGTYVNDFIDRGRVKKVYMQARCALPHAAGGPRPLVRAQRAGRDGAVLGLRHRRVDLRLAEAGALQRHPLGRDPRRGRAGQQLRRGDGARWRSSSSSCRRHRLSSGPACPTRSGCPAPRRRCSTPSRCWSCSSAWPRSTRAGRSRSSVMLVVPLGVLGALLAALMARPAATTSTSRSACSPPSVCRPRTPS